MSTSPRKSPPWHQGCLLTATFLVVLLLISALTGMRFSVLFRQQRVIIDLGSKAVLRERRKDPGWLQTFTRPEWVNGLQPYAALSVSRETSDEDLPMVARLTTLEYLDLTHSAITDAGLIHLKRLLDLQKLDISYTAVTDAGLAQLAEFKKLNVLDVRGTRVTRAAVAKLKRERAGLKVLGP